MRYCPTARARLSPSDVRSTAHKSSLIEVEAIDIDVGPVQGRHKGRGHLSGPAPQVETMGVVNYPIL